MKNQWNNYHRPWTRHKLLVLAFLVLVVVAIFGILFSHTHTHTKIYTCNWVVLLCRYGNTDEEFGRFVFLSNFVNILFFNSTPLFLFSFFLPCSAHTTQVYQVTRSGHEHCDVTEGILLDITPLVVDGRKLVTLYDKDLTEGVNLLIGE